MVGQTLETGLDHMSAGQALAKDAAEQLPHPVAIAAAEAHLLPTAATTTGLPFNAHEALGNQPGQ